MSLSSARLSRDSTLASAANNQPALKPGASGDAVQTLQRELIDLGFDMPRSTRAKGAPDGIYGQETEAVVKAFQAANSLNPDGIAGRDTLNALDQIFVVSEAQASLARRADLNSPAPFHYTDAN